MASPSRANLSCHVKCLMRPQRPGLTSRCFSTTSCFQESLSPAPPLLQRLRNDLKTSMKQKDTSRLAVLRNVLADVANASKTQSGPPKTDVQILAILRKRAQASAEAAKQFEDGGRNDLKEKEESQKLILQEYANHVETLKDEDVAERVKHVIDKMRTDGEKVDKGSVMRATLGPGGIFEGQAVEKQTILKQVEDMLKNLN